ncbi:E3 ubiquitin-protein ligase TRIM39-like [Notothenia coriiceps]|uniref:E3 ubiquitin-protein ligase TRIM39-like n=1 Tax=Notothenia coriiceps TaxID=8208 RepID=A0A6I9MUP6_9TELE|nr:PREDICTED: E3 ubiquitin-protein ligase TRIM39-like [Notothenia coriiceps]
MAALSFSERDLLCPQCSDIYYLPVLLNCGHNICRFCLKKFWEWKGCRECPVCQAVSVLGRPPINLELKTAADEYQVLKTRSNQDVCRVHKEKLNIFCHNDLEPICLVCQTSKQHKVHECSPVEEAATQKKKEISAMLESLRKHLRLLNMTKVQWEETKRYIQSQVNHSEAAIKEEFEKLHLFLREEENGRLKVLRQEEQIKTQVMCEKLENIQEQIKTLYSTISEVEGALRAKDLTFLQDFKQTNKRVKCTIQEPQCIRDILINSAKHLSSLRFEVWKKMASTVTCVPITLDPNTAQSNLKLSEDLTCVQFSSKQLLPDNPERFTSRVCVLGASGFTSGRHSWMVEVGQGKDWHIGVARESIKRRSTVFLNPSEGFWVIGVSNGDSFWAQTSPRTKLVLKQKPEKITVQLDYDKGKVVFINEADSTIIYAFKDRFTERVFPFFSPGLSGEGKHCSQLTICPQTVALNMESHMQ